MPSIMEEYNVLPIPIPCKTGIWANPINGHRLIRNPTTNSFVEFLDRGHYRKVNKDTAQLIYAGVWKMSLSAMVFRVFAGDHINKHGLNLALVYTAMFDFQTHEVTQEGEHDFLYWIQGDGSRELHRDLLVAKRMLPLKVKSFISFGWGSDLASLLPDDITMEECALRWYSGELQSLLRNNYGLRKHRFGVEIEFTGISRFQAAKVIAKHFGVLVHKIEFISGTSYYVTDPDGAKWRIIRDSSIHAERKDGGEADNKFKCELVTPILSYSQIEMLQTILRSLRRRGMIVNESCGIHIHVDVKGLNAFSLHKLVNIISAREELLFKALEVYPNRALSYCKRISSSFVRSLRNSAPQTLEQIKALWYVHCGVNPHATRYHALNLHSLWMGKGIEFRMFNSTTHAGKLKAYIQLCLAICEQARVKACASPQARHASSDKAQFRSWIALLDMKGEEFATARKHLLKNLEEREAA